MWPRDIKLTSEIIILMEGYILIIYFAGKNNLEDLGYVGTHVNEEQLIWEEFVNCNP